MNEPLNKYERKFGNVVLDVYDILDAYGVTSQPVGHAIKKLLMPGKRGHKNELQDLIEARQALDRAIEMKKGGVDNEVEK